MGLYLLREVVCGLARVIVSRIPSRCRITRKTRASVSVLSVSCWVNWWVARGVRGENWPSQTFGASPAVCGTYESANRSLDKIPISQSPGLAAVGLDSAWSVQLERLPRSLPFDHTALHRYNSATLASPPRDCTAVGSHSLYTDLWQLRPQC